MRVLAASLVTAVGIILILVPDWFDTSDAAVSRIFPALGTVLLVTGLTYALNTWLSPVIRSDTRIALREELEHQATLSSPTTLASVIGDKFEQLAELSKDPGIAVARRYILEDQYLRLTEASEEVRGLYISLSQDSFYDKFETLLDSTDTVRIRVLLLHPFSEHVRSRARDLAISTRDLQSEICDALFRLRALDTTSSRLQVRSYRDPIPSFGMTCVDNERAMRMALHWYMEMEAGEENFAVFMRDNDLTDEFLRDVVKKFEERWDSATEVRVLPVPAARLIETRQADSELQGTLELEFSESIDEDSLWYDFEPTIGDVDVNPAGTATSVDGKVTCVRFVCSGVAPGATYALTIRAETSNNTGVFIDRVPLRVSFGRARA
jgi:hypothetical protein